MAIRIVRLGSERHSGEGLRLGTVRRPPRGVPSGEVASRDFYDLWYPMLAPSAEAVALARAARSESEWKRFVRRYRREMSQPQVRATLDLLAALSHRTDFSVGCYCVDAARCHRSVLGELLRERGADVIDG
jgi:uncharacterized protein YeaO (DUF488 family)